MQNIIFDMGNVLIRFDPRHFIAREGVADARDRALLLDVVYRSGDWPLLDTGALSEAQLEARLLPRLPERLRGVAHRLISEWHLPIEPIPGMAEFVGECKARGFGIYLLSNAGLLQRTYWERVPGSQYFDGAVVSAYEGCVKPNPDIYARLLARYGLEAGDCIFVDDVQANVDGAVRAGMRGILFDGDVGRLREAILG